MGKEAKKSHPEIQGLLYIGLAITLSICLLTFYDGDHEKNWLGMLGYFIAWGLQWVMGMGSYFIVGYLAWHGWKLLASEDKPAWGINTVYFGLWTFSMCVLMNLFSELSPPTTEWIKTHVYSQSHLIKFPFPHKAIRYNLGGVPLYYLYKDLPSFNLHQMLSNVGIFLTFFMTASISFILLTNIRILDLMKNTVSFSKGIGGVVKRFYGTLKPEKKPINFERQAKIEKTLTRMPPKPTFVPPKPKPPTQKKKEAPKSPQATIYEGEFTKYRLPPLSLLTPAKKIDQPTLKKDLKKQAAILEETLQSFGIDAQVGEINCGPTITSFEVIPPVGVKVQKIKVLENDIKLNMQAESIRIIAPIPGKAAVGVEVPSPQPQEVGFKEMLSAYQKQHQFTLPLLLGKTVSGEDIFGDLTKMPHCLIAGATGSGKSVCINTIVLSILMNARPDEVKLLLIDPKKVELSNYAKLPHMIAPVITEAQGAYAALNWLVKEMQDRYEILKQMGLRNITAFNNRKIKQRFEESLGIKIPKKMSYIVAIIDEFADLMMASSSDLETPIARIAQMARAVGIHLVLATQRPSREVITGLIKANFPTRVAFKVSSRVNSQIILDENGAETLLGNGDLLFLPPGTSQILRAQGVFARDEDINRVIQYICDQAPTQYLIKSFDHVAQADAQFDPKDDLYKQAFDIVTQTGNASTTFLQRKLKIGYARAASLMDELEEQGIIGPQEGSRPRQVLQAEGLPEDDE